MVTKAQQLATDREEYRAWVAGQVRYVEETLRIDVWNSAALARAGKRVQDTGDAWQGYWPTVRPYCTTEFVEAVEQGVIRRMTLTDWRQMMGREREAVAVEADGEEGRDALRTLAYIRDWYSQRGELVMRARAAGIPWREIQAATGLSRPQVNRLGLEYTRALERDAMAADAAVVDAVEALDVSATDWAEWGTPESVDDDGEPF
jgi:hypothetical protein